LWPVEWPPCEVDRRGDLRRLWGNALIVHNYGEPQSRRLNVLRPIWVRPSEVVLLLPKPSGPGSPLDGPLTRVQLRSGVLFLVFGSPADVLALLEINDAPRG
jgi:hypothetical protein